MKEVKKFDAKITLSAKGKTMDAGKLMMIMGIKQGGTWLLFLRKEKMRTQPLR